jgi:uncharacterized protein YegL
MQTTIVGVLVDMTGSMQSTAKETINGVNEYLDGLKEIKGNVRVTLAVFNSAIGVNTLAAMAAPEEVRPLTRQRYTPQWNTPLLDAMAAVVLDIERQADKYSDPKVLVFVVTDGEENASREWTKEALLALISRKKEAGWAFAYFGADHDAFAQAGAIGVGQLNTVMYQKGMEEEAWRKLRVGTMSYATGQTTASNLFPSEN